MIYTYYGNELYHHGILGQRWGKKNGPPYPLGSSDHSASEKKAGWRKSLDSDSEKKQFKSDLKNYRKHGLSVDYEYDSKTGSTKITKFYTSDRTRELGADYVQKLKAASRRRTLAVFAGATVIAAGRSAVAEYLNTR